MTSILITNISHGLTGDAAGTRLSGAIRVIDGLIAETGELTPAPGERTVDASGCVVTPGLVNTHHHLFQSVLKAEPTGMNCALNEWLMRVPFTYWPHLDAEVLRVSARIGLTELALTGVTTVADHHYMFADTCDYDPAEVLFDTAGRMGLRYILGRGGATKGRAFDAPGIPPAPVETLENFLAGIEAAGKRWHDTSDFAMTRVAAAPATPTFSLEPGELREVAQTARAAGLKLHSHLSENGSYVDFTLEHYGKRPVHWLAEHDWLGPDVWFAHLVECDADEIAVLIQTGTAMSHCPQANARLGSGIAPADAMHRAGGSVSLAVDGAGANEAADMGAALYAAFSLHRASKGVGAVDAETVLHWATEGGARVLGYDRIGVLAPGMAADIAIFDISAPRNMGLHDPALAPIITGGATVRHSFVGGRPIVENGQIPGLDLGQLGADAARVVARLKEAAGS